MSGKTKAVLIRERTVVTREYWAVDVDEAGDPWLQAQEQSKRAPDGVSVVSDQRTACSGLKRGTLEEAMGPGLHAPRAVATASPPTFLPGAHPILQALCRATQCWGIRLSVLSPDASSGDTPAEVHRAAPWLTEEQSVQLWTEGGGYFLFDTEAECSRAFQQTVGPDGTTGLNPFAGSMRIYALTCSPDGTFQNENT